MEWTWQPSNSRRHLRKREVRSRASGRFLGSRCVAIGPAMRLALKLVFLLLQRRCEVLGMALSELDLDQGVWTIPASG